MEWVGVAECRMWQRFLRTVICPSTSIVMPHNTMPEGILMVNCLIMLMRNHEIEDGSLSIFSSGFN